MAVTVTIFDPETQNSKTINVAVESSMIQGDEDAEYDFYIRMTTDATRGPAGEDAIPTEVFRSLSDLALGTRRFKIKDTESTGDTDPYDTITDALEDYILKMVEGVNPGEHMYFGT